MPEITNLAKLTKAELVDAAVEAGVPLADAEASNRSDLIARLQRAAEPDLFGPAEAPTPAKALKKAQERVYLTIFEQDGPGGADDVAVGINGTAYQIKRGHEVLVPRAVVEVLRNAVQTVSTPLKEGGTSERQVPRFNFQVREA